MTESARSSGDVEDDRPDKLPSRATTAAMSSQSALERSRVRNAATTHESNQAIRANKPTTFNQVMRPPKVSGVETPGSPKTNNHLMVGTSHAGSPGIEETCCILGDKLDRLQCKDGQ